MTSIVADTPKMAYTISPLDTPWTKSVWTFFSPKENWKPWEKIAAQVCRLVLVVFLYPVECFGRLTLRNLYVGYKNRNIQDVGQPIEPEKKRFAFLSLLDPSKQALLYKILFFVGLSSVVLMVNSKIPHRI